MLQAISSAGKKAKIGVIRSRHVTVERAGNRAFSPLCSTYRPEGINSGRALSPGRGAFFTLSQTKPRLDPRPSVEGNFNYGHGRHHSQ